MKHQADMRCLKFFGLILSVLTLGCELPVHAATNPLKWDDALGLRVDIENAGNCPGGSNNSVQTVTNEAAVTGGVDQCSYKLAITVTGSVETQNAPYDYVYVNDVLFFSGEEWGEGCGGMTTKTVTKEIEVKAGDKITLTYDTSDPLYHSGAYATITEIELVEEGCSSGCEPGAGSVSNGSLHFSMNLGRTAHGKSAGALRIAQEGPSAVLGTPASLRYSSAWQGVVRIPSSATLPVRQVKAPQVLADVVTETANRFRIDFYSPDEFGPFNGTIYDQTGESSFVTWTVENLDPINNDHVRITETRGLSSKVSEFEWDAVGQGWQLITGNGERKEIKTSVVDPIAETVAVTQVVRNNLDVVVSKRIDIYNDFDWGRELIQTIIDPDGEALVTTRTFYDNQVTDGGAYKKLKSVVAPYGQWTRYQYDSQGRRTKTIEPFLDSPIAALDNQCKVTTVSYQNTAPQKTTVVTILGQEVERRYEVSSNSFDHTTTNIVSTEAGAAYNAASNLTATRQLIATGPFTGEILKTSNPDGTVESYSYSIVGDNKVVVVERGNQALSMGNRTTTTTDEAGNLVEETVYDIASNLLLSQKVVQDQDDFGRPTHITYDDGTSEYFVYGCCGLESYTDREGIVTEYSYDVFKRLHTEKRAGLTTRYAYDAEGRIKSRTRIGSDNSEIVQETNLYNVAGRLVSRTDALNNTTTYSEAADGSGRLVRTTVLPNTGTQVQVYHFDKRLYTTSGTAVRPTKKLYGVDPAEGYYEQNIFIGEGGAETEWTRNYYDIAKRVVLTLNAAGAESSNYYNYLGQLVKQVDADGVVSLFQYDFLGRPITRALDIDRNNAIGATDQISKAYYSVLEAHDEVVIRRDVTVTNDANVEVLASREDRTANGRKAWIERWGLLSIQTSVIGLGGLRTDTIIKPDTSETVLSYSYGRLTSSVIKAAGSGPVLSSQSYSYDSHGRTATVTDARSGTAMYLYDDLDRMTSATTPVPDVGQPAQTTEYEYNGVGQMVKTILPDDSEVDYAYFLTGNLQQKSGSQTATQAYTYTPQGRMKTLTTVGAAGPSTTTWAYHALTGELTAKIDPANKVVTYLQTAAGRILIRTWARGVMGIYQYDNGGRFTGVDYSDSTPDVSYTLNRLGQASAITDGSGSRTLTYQSDGRLSTEEYTAGLLSGVSAAHNYDLLHRRNSHRVEVGAATHEVNFGYDAASRLQTVQSGDAVTAYGYLTNSNLIGTVVQQHNSNTVLTTTKTYDLLNRLSVISASTSSGVVASHEYSYNLLNQRAEAELEDGSKWGYLYDGKGQVTSGSRSWSDNTLVAGQQFGYAYDDIGNRTSASVNGRTSNYTPNTLNQYSARTVPGALDVQGSAAADAAVSVNNKGTQRKGRYFYREVEVDNQTSPQYPEIRVNAFKAGVGAGGADLVSQQVGRLYLAQTPEVLSYDDDGNLISDGRWSYLWDAENRLIAMETISSVPALAKQKLEFVYDSLSRRVGKRSYGWNGSAYVLHKERRFVYDGRNLATELDGSNAIVQSYVWGIDLSGSLRGAGGVGGLLVIREAAADHYPAYDGGGNVIALIRNTDGSVKANYRYGPFGELVESREVGVENPFRFSTKYQDLESGLYYYGLRYYIPSIGRWLCRDPLGEKGGANTYSFVFNNANRWIDPDGRAPMSGGVPSPFPFFPADGSANTPPMNFPSEPSWLDNFGSGPIGNESPYWDGRFPNFTDEVKREAQRAADEAVKGKCGEMIGVGTVITVDYRLQMTPSSDNSRGPSGDFMSSIPFFEYDYGEPFGTDKYFGDTPQNGWEANQLYGTVTFQLLSVKIVKKHDSSCCFDWEGDITLQDDLGLSADDFVNHPKSSKVFDFFGARGGPSGGDHQTRATWPISGTTCCD